MTPAAPPTLRPAFASREGLGLFAALLLLGLLAARWLDLPGLQLWATCPLVYRSF